MLSTFSLLHDLLCHAVVAKEPISVHPLIVQSHHPSPCVHAAVSGTALWGKGPCVWASPCAGAPGWPTGSRSLRTSPPGGPPASGVASSSRAAARTCPRPVSAASFFQRALWHNSYLSIYLSIYLFLFLSNYPNISNYLHIYLSIWPGPRFASWGRIAACWRSLCGIPGPAATAPPPPSGFLRSSSGNSSLNEEEDFRKMSRMYLPSGKGVIFAGQINKKSAKVILLRQYECPVPPSSHTPHP